MAEKVPILGGRDIEDLNMGGTRVRGAFLMDTRITDAFAVNLSIEGEIDGMKVNGVEIAPLVAAELDRLHPTLPDLRPTTADGLRRGVEIVYGIWDELLIRVSALDESQVHARVDDEWSFAETLRHLVYATDCWFRHVVLDDPHPYHAIAISHAPATGQDPGIDLTANPSFAETMDVRRESQAELRSFVAELTDDDLQRMCEPTASPGNPSGAFKLGEALNVVLIEEYWHSTYAVRDLDVLTASG